ncbi:phage portal protein [Streptomyces sp. NPDC057854]|uniref:phage portal protein n=1 Tax=unclassified Streptomyces TaxID=2593676 RepID=UPI003677E9E3
MAKIWSSLFKGKSEEERLTLDDLYQQVIKYQGLDYPVSQGGAAGENYEAIEHDFEGYVQQAFKADGIVFACMVARMRLFSQARFQWQKMQAGRPGDLFGTKELKIFEEPWPVGGSTIGLLNRAIQQADLAGNHYVVRETTSRGAVPVSRLRVLRPNWVRTILTAPPDEAVQSDIAGWIYMPGGNPDPTRWKFYEVGSSRFAHWAPTPDPEAQYKGMSWLTPVIREIMSDKAATKHKGKFFDNAATPSFAMSFKETVTNEQFKEFIRTMRESHQGADNAYKPLFVGGGADITPLMYDLRQLDFKATQGAGETRIAAAARVHPVIVGLSEGMQGSSLNAGNFKAAKDAWADGEMRPLWESVCQAYRPLVRVPEGARLHYDDRHISFLRDDISEKAKVLAQEADILQGLVMQGWTQDSAIEALMESGCTGDWRKLKHTGLFSVQLQPPMPDGPPTKVVDQNGKPVKQQPAAPGSKAGKLQPATGPGAAGRPAIGQQRPGAKPPAQPKGSRDGDDASEEA